MTYLIVFLGGGIGASLRHAVNLGGARLLGNAFPYSTMAINIVGSFLMGLIVEFLIRAGLPQQLRLFLMTGILGGFTTFSAYSLETILLYERGETLAALAYAVGSVVLAIAALLAGLWIVRTWMGPL